jgi:hypothetical protein
VSRERNILVDLERFIAGGLVADRTHPSGSLLLQLQKRRCIEALIMCAERRATGNVDAKGRERAF